MTSRRATFLQLLLIIIEIAITFIITIGAVILLKVWEYPKNQKTIAIIIYCLSSVFIYYAVRYLFIKQETKLQKIIKDNFVDLPEENDNVKIINGDIDDFRK